MATEVPKAPDDFNATTGPPGGCWQEVVREDGSRSALLCCPRCGKLQSLSAHVIAPDGAVSPSVECAYRCGFHEGGGSSPPVRLLGWVP
jgi:hypothetical protein